MTLPHPLAAAVLGVAVIAATPALAAAYMKYEGVDGRMMSAPIESAALDSPPETRGCSGNLGAGTATVRMGNIRNPELVRVAESHATIKKATMFVRKAGGGDATLEVKLENIMISSATSSQGPYQLSYRGGSWTDTACPTR